MKLDKLQPAGTKAFAYYGHPTYLDHITRLKIAITPRTSQFKMKEIIENKAPEAHNLRIKDKTTKTIDIENKAPVENKIKTESTLAKNRSFASLPISFNKEIIETENVYPQCDMKVFGIYLDCLPSVSCVDQKNNFKDDYSVKSIVKLE